MLVGLVLFAAISTRQFAGPGRGVGGGGVPTTSLASLQLCDQRASVRSVNYGGLRSLPAGFAAARADAGSAPGAGHLAWGGHAGKNLPLVGSPIIPCGHCAGAGNNGTANKA